MIIIGCGPIACELGQGFARLGTNVSIIDSNEKFLSREDSECSIYLKI